MTRHGAGLDTLAVKRIETGRRALTLDEAGVLADLFAVPIEYVAGFWDEKWGNPQGGPYAEVARGILADELERRRRLLKEARGRIDELVAAINATDTERQMIQTQLRARERAIKTMTREWHYLADSVQQQLNDIRRIASTIGEAPESGAVGAPAE